MTRKTASATIYLQEEISNARLHCDELKNLVVRSMNLVNASRQREHLFAVAGDIIHGVPSALMKLESALNAAAMAVNKIDYEELRQVLRPEKVDELERVLDDIRMRLPRRTGRPFEGIDD
jgi:hypothetical protein